MNKMLLFRLTAIVLMLLLLTINALSQLWLPSHGPYGGNAQALATHPLNGHIFIGGDPNSVFRSTDEGQTWSRVQNNCSNSATHTLACGPTGILYNGTEGGLFFSSNEGAVWVYASSVFGKVLALAVAPGGSIFAGTDYGIWRSTNSGASFSQVASFAVQTLSVRSNGTILAGTINQGIYRSTNDGFTWTPSNAGLGATYVIALCVHSFSGNFYAGSNKIYRSTDDGVQWSPIGNFLSPLALATREFPSALFAGTANDGVYRTTNEGATWEKKSTGLKSESVCGLFYLPQNRIFALTNAGVFISSNAGDNWDESNEGYGNARIGSLLLRPGGVIFAGDITAGLFRSSDAGNSWHYWKDLLPNWGPLSIAANNNGDLFIAIWRGLYRSLDSGATWSKLSVPNVSQSFQCLLVNDSGHIFLGTTGYFIHKSTDNGNHWAKAATGMIDSLVHALALHHASGMIFAGTEHQGVIRSTNNGQTWNATGSGLSSVYIDAIAVDQSNGNVYVSTHDSVIHRSTNLGISWENIQHGRNPRPIAAIIVHPSGHIFLGTRGDGVERSTNLGQSWESFNAGLNANVEALAIDSVNILYAGTYAGVQKTSIAVPVEHLRFSALLKDQNVFLSWSTASETNNYGFAVERSPVYPESRIRNPEMKWGYIGFVPGRGTTAESNAYSFLDSEPGSGKLLYRLRQIDLDGTSHYSDAVGVEVDGSPAPFSLGRNYPNPFHDRTTITRGGKEDLPGATLLLYDRLGRPVLDLSDQIRSRVCVTITRDQLPGPGLYFYRFRTQGSARTYSLQLLEQ